MNRSDGLGDSAGAGRYFVWFIESVAGVLVVPDWGKVDGPPLVLRRQFTEEIYKIC